MNYTELFINKDDTLLIKKELVRVLGDVNEAIVLNQLNYWIEINKKANHNQRDGRFWVFNSYQMWQEKDFDFWSVDTVKRIFGRLENKKLVISANYNDDTRVKTKWYTIDYEKLQELLNAYQNAKNENSDSASCVEVGAFCTDGKGKMPQSINNIYNNTITNTENTNRDYITENTDKNFFQTKKARAFGESKYQNTKKAYENMLNRLDDICDKYCGACDGEIVYNVLEHYFERYKEKTGKLHPALSNETLEYIVSFMLTYEDDKYHHFGKVIDIDGAYLRMVDSFFDTNFGKRTGKTTNWHLPHFMSRGVLDKLAQRCIDPYSDIEDDNDDY